MGLRAWSGVRIIRHIPENFSNTIINYWQQWISQPWAFNGYSGSQADEDFIKEARFLVVLQSLKDAQAADRIINTLGWPTRHQIIQLPPVDVSTPDKLLWSSKGTGVVSKTTSLSQPSTTASRGLQRWRHSTPPTWSLCWQRPKLPSQEPSPARFYKTGTPPVSASQPCKRTYTSWFITGQPHL